MDSKGRDDQGGLEDEDGDRSSLCVKDAKGGGPSEPQVTPFRRHCECETSDFRGRLCRSPAPCLGLERTIGGCRLPQGRATIPVIGIIRPYTSSPENLINTNLNYLDIL